MNWPESARRRPNLGTLHLFLLHVHLHLNCLLLTLVRLLSSHGPFEKLVGAVRSKAPSACIYTRNGDGLCSNETSMQSHSSP
ncbi:uncharacterized protein LAESUDRAFT_85556 [Laetiporus sulphureus 93-53]|uniref:Uncharacterized protein n=1 Tax=Laetiporus sulphureus 93-53 TaxID=1314785 RepID=A0A165AUI2_9APHY|nr:uncharacterized protein LAESUDRAFT_85556 [Laetiporus sulphureus 93-53]KZS99686.1 hypothetical protein LAESUDRAFT_85556 [Laetiporus sulphureus 93-53]